MSRYSRNWVVKSGNEGRKNRLAVSTLEVFSHIIRDLTNTVKGGETNSWISVLEMSQNYWNHSADILDIFYVFTNLRKSHEACIFIPPVSIILECIVDDP